MDFSAPPSVLQASSLIKHIVCLCQESFVHNTRINLNENKEHAQSNNQSFNFVLKMFVIVDVMYIWELREVFVILILAPLLVSTIHLKKHGQCVATKNPSYGPCCLILKYK